MAEAQNNVNTDGVVETNPIVQEALEAGWKPLEEFEGPQEKWIDAPEFVRRGELFKKIDDLKAQAWKAERGFKQELELMKKHFDSVKETEYKRALETLKAQKRDALENNDAAAVIELDDKIDALKDEQAAAKIQQQNEVTPSGQPPEIAEWLEKNSWYNQTQSLRFQADGFGMEYMENHPNASLNDMLRYVDKKIREINPEKFGSATRVIKNSGSTVETGGSSSSRVSGGRPAKLTVNDLNDTERQVMKSLVGRGVLTQAQYLEQLADNGR